MVAEQTRQPLARAARIAGDDRAPALAALVRQVVGDLVVDVEVGGAFGGEIARGEGFEVDDRLRLGGTSNGVTIWIGRPDDAPAHSSSVRYSVSGDSGR